MHLNIYNFPGIIFLIEGKKVVIIMIYRKARMTDIGSIQALINDYAEKGLMLPRSLNVLYESLLELTVAEENGQIIGVAGLHIIWENLAEVRSLAVAEKNLGQGIGRTLIKMLLEQAKELGINKVFALTYKQKFFLNCGFFTVSKDDLPHKVWKECINCPKFPNCDEVAVAINL